MGVTFSRRTEKTKMEKKIIKEAERTGKRFTKSEQSKEVFAQFEQQLAEHKRKGNKIHHIGIHAHNSAYEVNPTIYIVSNSSYECSSSSWGDAREMGTRHGYVDANAVVGLILAAHPELELVSVMSKDRGNWGCSFKHKDYNGPI